MKIQSPILRRAFVHKRREYLKSGNVSAAFDLASNQKLLNSVEGDSVTEKLQNLEQDDSVRLNLGVMEVGLPIAAAALVGVSAGLGLGFRVNPGIGVLAGLVSGAVSGVAASALGFGVHARYEANHDKKLDAAKAAAPIVEQYRGQEVGVISRDEFLSEVQQGIQILEKNGELAQANVTSRNLMEASSLPGDSLDQMILLADNEERKTRLASLINSVPQTYFQRKLNLESVVAEALTTGSSEELKAFVTQRKQELSIISAQLVQLKDKVKTSNPQTKELFLDRIAILQKQEESHLAQVKSALESQSIVEDLSFLNQVDKTTSSIVAREPNGDLGRVEAELRDSLVMSQARLEIDTISKPLELA